MTNDEMRHLVGETYFMDIEDRMTLDLLNHFAFVLHENVTELTDEEIELTRNFARKYLSKNYKWKTYVPEFNYFANRQRFEAIMGYIYEPVEKELFDKISAINNDCNIIDWNFDVYFGVDYENCLLLARKFNNDGNEKISLIYDIYKKSFTSCDIEISCDFDLVGNIFKHDLNTIEKIKNKYPSGTRIKLNHMVDEHCVPAGTMGTVDFVDSMGNIQMNWDDGSTLALIETVDSFEVISIPKEKNNMEVKI